MKKHTSTDSFGATDSGTRNPIRVAFSTGPNGLSDSITTLACGESSTLDARS
jgi:hypothetical protein